ncbi:hypothetical protein C8R44DRAFT_776419 [Mycena epipterygia]|nr:hypothetical protein C8R44DRAFT_776419 [Mycena epipterygia]
MLLRLLLGAHAGVLAAAHLLEAVVRPGAVDGCGVGVGRSEGVLLCGAGEGASASKNTTARTTPALPASAPPATQTAQILVEQTVVVAPELADDGDKGGVAVEALLVGLACGLGVGVGVARERGCGCGGRGVAGRRGYGLVCLGLIVVRVRDWLCHADLANGVCIELAESDDRQ